MNHTPAMKPKTSPKPETMKRVNAAMPPAMHQAVRIALARRAAIAGMNNQFPAKTFSAWVRESAQTLIDAFR